MNGDTDTCEINSCRFKWLKWKSEKNKKDHGVSHRLAAKMLMFHEAGGGPNPSPEYPHQGLSICLTPDSSRLITIAYEDSCDESGEYTFIITLWETTKAEERRLKDGL